MKNLLLITVLGGGLVLPQNKPVPQPDLASMPATIQPSPQGIIAPAIAIGVGVGVVGWGALKGLEHILKIWEHRLTNGGPDHVVFTFAEDEYPQ